MPLCGNIGHVIDRRKEFDGTESLTAVQSYVLGTNRSNQDWWTVLERSNIIMLYFVVVRHSSICMRLCRVWHWSGCSRVCAVTGHVTSWPWIHAIRRSNNFNGVFKKLHETMYHSANNETTSVLFTCAQRRQERKRLGALNPLFSGLAYELCHRKILFVSLCSLFRFAFRVIETS
jgi:hypothetical protein